MAPVCPHLLAMMLNLFTGVPNSLFTERTILMFLHTWGRGSQWQRRIEEKDTPDLNINSMEVGRALRISTTSSNFTKVPFTAFQSSRVICEEEMPNRLRWDCSVRPVSITANSSYSEEERPHPLTPHAAVPQEPLGAQYLSHPASCTLSLKSERHGE